LPRGPSSPVNMEFFPPSLFSFPIILLLCPFPPRFCDQCAHYPPFTTSWNQIRCFLSRLLFRITLVPPLCPFSPWSLPELVCPDRQAVFLLPKVSPFLFFPPFFPLRSVFLGRIHRLGNPGCPPFLAHAPYSPKPARTSHFAFGLRFFF